MTTRADFTIADVLAWARTKPADDSYDYNSNTNCGLCRFLRETGRAANPTAGGSSWSDWTRAPYAGREVVLNSPIRRELGVALQAGTFGSLVAHLEKLAPATPVTKSDWLHIDAYLTPETVRHDQP